MFHSIEAVRYKNVKKQNSIYRSNNSEMRDGEEEVSAIVHIFIVISICAMCNEPENNTCDKKHSE